MAKICGIVASIRHKAENGFWVFTMVVDESDPHVPDTATVVAGRLYGLLQVRPGTPVSFLGSWKSHPKFGRQFIPSGWQPYARNEHDIARFLHECVEGFADSSLARLFAGRFGLETFEVLSEDPDRARALAGADDPFRVRIDQAIQGWQNACSLSGLGAYLQDFDIHSNTIEQISRTFGTGALNTILQDPYRLLEVDGFPLAKADALARRIGMTMADPRRIDGAVLWSLRRAARQGHLFLRHGGIIPTIDDILHEERAESFDGVNLASAVPISIRRLAARKAVCDIENVGVYLPTSFMYERESAKKLAQFLTPVDLGVDLRTFIEAYERRQHIELSDAQKGAVHKLVQNRVLVLTGLPGTGKTTLVRAFVHLFKESRLTYSLMAPTGIAAKRLAAVTGSEAATIHRSLKYDGDSWGHNVYNRLLVDAVVVDEMSMVDQELFYRLLDALAPGVMLVLVGDDAQLPSVGAGNVLRELVSCPDIPRVRLTQIHRQASTSKIVLSAHRVNRGELPLLDRTPSDFQFVACDEEEVIVDLIVKMSDKLKGRNENFQVLTPKYQGKVGVDNLNDRLREALNPSDGRKKEWKAGDFHVRVGDRLMVTKNDYGLAIYNGDMGKLHDIRKDELVVRIHGFGADAVDIYVDIPKEKAPEILRLAYAITVHKSQGSEYGTVLLPIVRSQGIMLQRELFYTAITRARKKVWLLGSEEAVSMSVANDRVVLRNTVFGQSLTKAVRESSGVEAEHGREVCTSRKQEPPGQSAGRVEGSA